MCTCVGTRVTFSQSFSVLLAFREQMAHLQTFPVLMDSGKKGRIERHENYPGEQRTGLGWLWASALYRRKEERALNSWGLTEKILHLLLTVQAHTETSASPKLSPENTQLPEIGHEGFLCHNTLLPKRPPWSLASAAPRPVQCLHLSRPVLLS